MGITPLTIEDGRTRPSKPTVAVLVTMSENGGSREPRSASRRRLRARDFFPLNGQTYQEKDLRCGDASPAVSFKRGKDGPHRKGNAHLAPLIDRPIRPLFPEGFINDVRSSHRLLSVNSGSGPRRRPRCSALSAALSPFGACPFLGPDRAAGAKSGTFGGQITFLNPTATANSGNRSSILVVAGHGGRRADGGIRGRGAWMKKSCWGAVMFGHETDAKVAIKAHQ